jgi:hypothetical protein
MKYTDEESVKEALGITSRRNLSRQNVVKFAAMMPDMDKELAVKIVEQFPAFTKFVSKHYARWEEFKTPRSISTSVARTKCTMPIKMFETRSRVNSRRS